MWEEDDFSNIQEQTDLSKTLTCFWSTGCSKVITTDTSDAGKIVIRERAALSETGNESGSKSTSWCTA